MENSHDLISHGFETSLRPIVASDFGAVGVAGIAGQCILIGAVALLLSLFFLLPKHWSKKGRLLGRIFLAISMALFLVGGFFMVSIHL